MAQLIDFIKDPAAQKLLAFAGIYEPYEEIISRVSLEILRESAPDSEIESIRHLRQAGRHPGFRAGGTPLEEDSTKIILQDMTLPFDIEITVRSGRSGSIRRRLIATFTFKCREMDQEPQTELDLDIHEEVDA